MHNIVRCSLMVCILFSTFGIARADYQTYDQALVAARALFEKGDYEGAQQKMEQGLALAKTNDERFGAHKRIAETYNRRKLYPQAREQWERALQIPGVSADNQAAIQLLVATSYKEEKNWQAARSEFEKVLATPGIEVNTEYAAHVSLLTVYLGSDEPSGLDKARDEMYAILDDPQFTASNQALAAIVFGDGLRDKGKFDDARAAYGEVDNINGVPTSLRLLGLMGIARSYDKEGKAKEAYQIYTKAFKFGFDEGAKLFEGDKFEECIAVMRLCLDIPKLPKPLNTGPLYYIGASLMELKEPLKALAVLRSASIEPTAAELAALGPMDLRSFRSFQTSARVRVIRLYAGSPNKENQAIAVTLINELLQDPNADLNDNGRSQLQQILRSLS